tara:strand:- start:2522 stop:2992 length:471 start_codon:yes stop_codon:yes gene_type:complete
MATTTFSGVARSYGGRSKGVVSPGVLTMSVTISGDSAQADPTADASRMRIGTSATSGELFVLPKGAIPTSCVSLGGGTASDTVDIGTAADGNGFFVGISSVTVGTTSTPTGALVLNDGVPADVQVTIDANAGSPTGTASFVFMYTVADNGKSGALQ